MKIEVTFTHRENNFTLLRLFAALAVLYGHSYDLSNEVFGGKGEDPISHFLITFWGESLPSLSIDLFFVTSGFLVCASYIQRESLIAFIEARMLRILPGLIVAVLFCIFLVGPFVTTETLANYFLSPSTWSYFKHNTLLIIGVQFDLPGVFTNNPYPISVNGSLWTLPVEVKMYVGVAILGGLSLLKDERSFNLLGIILCLMYAQSATDRFIIANEPRNAHLSLLFMLGAFFYVNRSNLRLGFTPLGALGLLVFLTKEYNFSLFIKSLGFSYFVLILALHPKLKLPSIDRWEDISYGLYIYAFPVQQSLAYFIPQVRPMSMFVLSTIITVVLAILSWRLVEKPALKLKNKIRYGRHFDDVRAR